MVRHGTMVAYWITHLRQHLRTYTITFSLALSLLLWGITTEKLSFKGLKLGAGNAVREEPEEELLYGIANWPPELPEQLYAEFTPHERETIENSIKRLVDPRYQEFEDSIYRFERFGEKALPLLTEILTMPNYDPKVYLNTIYTVGRMGEGGNRGAEVLFTYLKHPDTDTRIAAIRALGKIGIKARHSVVYLRPLLRDPNPRIRHNTKTALLNIGTQSALRAAKMAR